MEDRTLLRADEALVLGRTVGRSVEVELDVLHPDALEHRLIVVARRRLHGVVAGLLQDAILRLEPRHRVKRSLCLGDERGVAGRLRKRCQPRGDDSLIVNPSFLAIVRASVGEAGNCVSA